MMRLSQEEADRLIQEQNKKLRSWFPKDPGDCKYEPDEGPESSLSKKIRAYGKDHGYPTQVNRQSKKAKGFAEPGWPDVVMALPGGRTVYLELKCDKGRLSGDQIRHKLMFMQLGHEWHEVRSYRQFLDIVEGI